MIQKNIRKRIFLAVFFVAGFFVFYGAENAQAFTCGVDTVTQGALTYGTVSAADGRCWLDRNLGSTQVATSASPASYEWLFQWGRAVDGHQYPTSSHSTTKSSTDTVPLSFRNKFILTATYASGSDWRSPKNDNLWQGIYGINNPCPTGFRIPTNAEFLAMVSAEGITNSTTAFNSSLKLPMAGWRYNTNGAKNSLGTNGFYWTSTVSNYYSYYVSFDGSQINTNYSRARGYGLSVRCIMEPIVPPAATTQGVSNITDVTATGNGTVTSTGFENPTREIEWGTTSGVYAQSCSAGTGSTGVFSCAMTGLSPTTTYYVRAKVTNSEGTAYGSETSFTTIDNPDVSTSAVTTVRATSAIGNGNLIDTGGSNPTREIEWGTTSGLYTQSCSAGTGGTGAYSCALTSLTPETTYYVRAKSTNPAGTVYGAETSFTTLPTQVSITDPTTASVSNAVGAGYLVNDNGTINNTDQITVNTEVTFQTGSHQALFPTGTTITEQASGHFNFENFTFQETNAKVEQPDSRTAVQLGIPGEKLNFSQNITMTIFVGNAYNDQEMDVLYKEEGETTWNALTTCTITSGNCVFATNHATIYTINGNLQSTGDAPMNLNTEVVDTLTLDCYETTAGSGNYDVTLGTTSNPGFVTAGTPAVGTSTCDATTNDDQGYYLSVVDDNAATNTVLTHNDPNTAAVYEIQDLTQYTESTPNTINWNAPTTKGLGFSIISFPDTDTANNTFDGVWTETGSCPEGNNPDSNDYAGIPDTPEAIAAVPEYSANLTTTNICYKVDVPASQPSGIYTGSVTYTATSDASSYLN